MGGVGDRNSAGRRPALAGVFLPDSERDELDLLLERGRRRLAVECKASKSPQVGPGFYTALKDLDINKAWVIAPVEAPYPLTKGVMIGSPLHLLSSGDLE